LIDRRRSGGVISSPVLIGAVTVLVAIVAVFLAYNANNGLPFVPRYDLHVQVRDASELTSGAEVHMAGGALVGHVDSIDPTRSASGQPIAVLNLALNKSIEPLPVDSTWRVRLKAAIGLKYLELTPGRSMHTLRNGATVPLSQTSEAVDLDQVLGMYTPPTRAGIRAATAGYGYGLAGRGSDLNDAIRAFVPLVTDLGPVMRNLASPRTDFGGFFHGLEAFSHAVAPVAPQQADLYVNMATTFRALAGVARPFLQNWISQTPPTFRTVIAQSPIIQPFLTDTAALFKTLRPGFVTLPRSAPVLAQTFRLGIHNLPPTFSGPQSLNAEVTSLARALAAYGQNPTVQQGLDRLTLTASSLRSPLAFLAPVQATCNYITLSLRNFASLLGDPVATGTRFRFSVVAMDDVPGEESVPSQSPFLTPDTSALDEHGPIHVDPYPNTNSPGETPECSAGNEPFSAAHASIGNPPGNVGLKTETTTRSTR
jgi:phospholipid/cholesterol/gamma-HCH transport system substrate-binding protein